MYRYTEQWNHMMWIFGTVILTDIHNINIYDETSKEAMLEQSKYYAHY